MSRLIKTLLVIGVACLVVLMISQGESKKKEVIVVPRKEEIKKEYPTNKNELESTNTFIDERLGIVGTIPNGYKLVDSNWTEISSDRDTFIILGDSTGEYFSPIEVEEALAPFKEQLSFTIDEERIKVTLFDFTGGIENIHIGEREGIIESENLYGSNHKEYISLFFNFQLEGRAVAAGLISENDPDYKSLERFVESIVDIKYTGTQDPDEIGLNREINFEGKTFNVPETFSEERDKNTLVFSPQVCSDDVFSGVRIILFKEDRPDIMPDLIYKKEEVLKALTESSEYSHQVEILDYDEIPGGSRQEELITLIPKLYGDVSDQVLNIKTIHVSLNQGHSRIHVIVSGRSASFFTARVLAENILRRIY